MRAGSDKWWLLPSGILSLSAMVAVGILVFGSTFAGRSATDCSGAFAGDYACHQERYRDLVRASGVEAAFAELKDQYGKNEFSKPECHQIAHIIGRAAVERYGDLSEAYARGDNFCFAGYYHGAMETFVAKRGADRILKEANTICADFRERKEHSFYHYNCVHGLGHGFMEAFDNELFEALEACDALEEEWERGNCYSGVFMENMIAGSDPDRTSYKYLDPSRPLYPCTGVESRYKYQCYEEQAPYALNTQDGDFARVFNLCAEAEEDDLRLACYQGLGASADGRSTTEVAKTKDICMLGRDYDARSYCLVGAVAHSIAFYQSDEQAKELCGSVEADLRDVCLRATKEVYRRLFEPNTAVEGSL